MGNGNRMDNLAKLRTIMSKGPMDAKPLIEAYMRETGISSRDTVYRHLNSYIDAGKILRIGHGRYALPEHINASMAHSRRLVIGFDAILAEEWLLFDPPDENKLTLAYRDKLEHEGARFKKYAIKHLETGYPKKYRVYKRWQSVERIEDPKFIDRLAKKISAMRVLERKLNSESHEPTRTPATEKQLERRRMTYKLLSKELELIIYRIKAGIPLRGYCGMCREEDFFSH